MTILSVVKDVAHKVGLETPTEVMASTERDMVEMQSLIKEVVADIFTCYDWQVLRTLETITGDGSTQAHSLPSDYERMLKGANIWSSRWTWELMHFVSTDEWLEYDTVPYTFINGRWTIFGGSLNILPVMTATETAKYFYVSNLVVTPSSGSNKAAFDADDDTFRLSEELLTLGLIWKWRAKKGQAYSEAMQDYEIRKQYLIDKDIGGKPVIRGKKFIPTNAKRAFPQEVGG